MILDSTFVHDLVREEQVATDKLEDLIDAGTPVALSTVTVFEVGVGLRGPGATHEERFSEVVNDIEVVPLGLDEAWRALLTQRDLYDRGEAIGARDVLIAGTAAERADTRVLTRNVDEFARVDAIEVESY